MATNFLSLPMTAGGQDIPVGIDEMGNTVFETVGGVRYSVKPQAPQRESYARAAWDAVRSDPVGTAKNMLAGIAGGAWDAISTARRSWTDGDVTYGDVANTAGLVSLPAVAGKYDPAVANMGAKAYHQSHADFDAFEPSRSRGASYFAATPEAAAKGASAGQNEMARHFAPSREKQRLFNYEVDIDESGIEGLNYTPTDRAWYDALPNEIVGDDALSEVMSSKPWRIQWWDDFYDDVPLDDGTYKYVKKPMKQGKTYQDVLNSGRDIYGREIAHYGAWSDERASAQRILDEGMTGYLLNDEAGISLAIADPSAINIIRKYGWAAAAPLMAANGSDQAQY